MKLLVYAANLHVGGGVQVATSVVSELAQLVGQVSDLTIWVSSAIDENLQEVDFDPSFFDSYEVIDHRGPFAFWSRDRHRLHSYDGVLVIFGPVYLGWKRPVTVMGFAQPWVINEHLELYKFYSFPLSFLMRCKHSLQKRLFKKADWLVAELEHVRSSLIKKRIGCPSRIVVIPNCVSSIYLMPNKWRLKEFPERKAQYRLGFLGRNYLHKNTHIFPEVLILLREEHGLDVEFVVTFTSDEWAACSKEFQAIVTNVGPLKAFDCPAFYQTLDGVVFPSLLECFSATPIEAMAMKLPLFASDRTFVRDVCGDFADYFDPLSPEDVARTIASKLLQPRNENKLERAHQHALRFSNASDRASSYLKLLQTATHSKSMGKEQ